METTKIIWKVCEIGIRVDNHTGNTEVINNGCFLMNSEETALQQIQDRVCEIAEKQAHLNIKESESSDGYKQKYIFMDKSDLLIIYHYLWTIEREEIDIDLFEYGYC